jgi:uncharacterized protein
MGTGILDRAGLAMAPPTAKRFSPNIRDATIVNLTPEVITACTSILEAGPVRAMDALHVACAVRWEAELFVSADERQISAAKKAGLRTRLV